MIVKVTIVPHKQDKWSHSKTIDTDNPNENDLHLEYINLGEMAEEMDIEINGISSEQDLEVLISMLRNSRPCFR